MQNKKTSREEFKKHLAEEEHKIENPLRDVILGGQDGLVNALGIILGVLAASNDVHILISTVLAATFAESLSMGAVAYTSAISQRDFYESERRKAKTEIEKYPEYEKDELREIYADKGFGGKILEEIVQTISANKSNWVDTVMSEQLHLSPVNTREVLKSSVIVTIATAIGHIIPLLPFFFLSSTPGLITAVALSAITLFAVGVYQALTLVGSWWKSGIRLIIIGLAAAFIGYFIARLFHVSAG